jgi:hypothetical protein
MRASDIDLYNKKIKKIKNKKGLRAVTVTAIGLMGFRINNKFGKE